MREWNGPTRGGAVDTEIIEELNSRVRNCLSSCPLTPSEIDKIVHDTAKAVQYAFVGRDNQLISNKPGRPARAAQTLLAKEVPDILEKNGIRGNWMALGDDEEDGEIGVVALAESYAQSALSDAIGRHQQIVDQAAIDEQNGTTIAVNNAKAVSARPARLSKAGRVLGKLIRE